MLKIELIDVYKRQPDDNLYDVDGYKVIINKVLDSQMNYITISYGGLLSRDSFSVDAVSYTHLKLPIFLPCMNQ